MSTETTMTPTKIAYLEGEYLRLARVAKAGEDYIAAAAYQHAATLLVQAAECKRTARRRFNRPMDTLSHIKG
jgi:hypothetical protein